MASSICPFCQKSFALSNETHQDFRLSFEKTKGINLGRDAYIKSNELVINNIFFKCPNCECVNIKAELSYGTGSSTLFLDIFPLSSALKFPDYIPQAIRDDYEEACAIISLSPKASATLSRRCLQSMISDFWGINENTLFKSISALEGKLPVKQWQVIDSIRRIGNIGAHMEKDINLIIDIETEEATKLIKMIELLLRQWDIERHEQEKLYDDIIAIDNAKQTERKSAE